MRSTLLIIAISACIFLALQIILLYRDGKQQKQPVPKAKLLQATPMLLAILGFFMFLAPWINIPVIGGISFVRMITDMGIHGPDKGMIVYGILIFITFGLMVMGNFFQLLFKAPVKSPLSLVLDIILGLSSSILGILAIMLLKESMQGAADFPLLAELLQITVGFGLYVIAAIGFIYCAVVVVLRIKAMRAKPEQGEHYGQLRELKQLLDDGIITQEEFDTKKAAVLND